MTFFDIYFRNLSLIPGATDVSGQQADNNSWLVCRSPKGHLEVRLYDQRDFDHAPRGPKTTIALYDDDGEDWETVEDVPVYEVAPLIGEWFRDRDKPLTYDLDLLINEEGLTACCRSTVTFRDEEDAYLCDGCGCEP